MQTENAVLRTKELRGLDGNDLRRLVQIDALEAVGQHGDLFGRRPIFGHLPIHDVARRKDADDPPVFDDGKMPDAMGGHQLADFAGGRPRRAEDDVGRHDLRNFCITKAFRGRRDVTRNVPLGDETGELAVIVVDDKATDVMRSHRHSGLLNAVLSANSNDCFWTAGRFEHVGPFCSVIQTSYISIAHPLDPSN